MQGAPLSGQHCTAAAPAAAPQLAARAYHDAQLDVSFDKIS